MNREFSAKGFNLVAFFGAAARKSRLTLLKFPADSLFCSEPGRSGVVAWALIAWALVARAPIAPRALCVLGARAAAGACLSGGAFYRET